jgi:hypothetical protein
MDIALSMLSNNCLRGLLKVSKPPDLIKASITLLFTLPLTKRWQKEKKFS